jgi:hypothetical protein
MLAPTPFKFIHTPNETLILYEEFVDFRQIFTDGRALPKDPEPAWFGYSVGRWEGGAFIVDTRGFNDKSWLDDDGHPHSDALHTVERFRRPDYGHLTMEITFDDPKAYVKPWNATGSGTDRRGLRQQLRRPASGRKIMRRLGHFRSFCRLRQGNTGRKTPGVSPGIHREPGDTSTIYRTRNCIPALTCDVLRLPGPGVRGPQQR